MVTEKPPVRVYLDSSDYSTLSKTTGLSPALIGVRERLLSWANSGEVEFRYSGAHICEISPLNRKYVAESEARAEMLYALCGRKTLMAWHELLKLEISAFCTDTGPPCNVYSDEGDWFPDVSGCVSPISYLEAIKEFDKAAAENGLNRAQRRALKQKNFKGGALREDAKRRLLSEQEHGLNEVLDLYPMREQDASVFRRYVFGQASAIEAEEAFLSSLREPCWMMKWFERHTETLSPVIQWLRGPGKKMQRTVADIARQARDVREQFSASGRGSGDIPAFDSRAKMHMQQNILSSLVERLSSELALVGPSNTDIERVFRNAPGFAVGVYTAVASMWSSVSEQPREPKESDFVDVIHSFYVPYVDVFRADAYMAPIVHAAAKSRSTVVVPRLIEIVGAIESRMAN